MQGLAMSLQLHEGSDFIVKSCCPWALRELEHPGRCSSNPSPRWNAGFWSLANNHMVAHKRKIWTPSGHLVQEWQFQLMKPSFQMHSLTLQRVIWGLGGLGGLKFSWNSIKWVEGNTFWIYFQILKLTSGIWFNWWDLVSLWDLFNKWDLVNKWNLVNR